MLSRASSNDPSLTYPSTEIFGELETSLWTLNLPTQFQRMALDEGTPYLTVPQSNSGNASGRQISGPGDEFPEDFDIRVVDVYICNGSGVQRLAILQNIQVKWAIHIRHRVLRATSRGVRFPKGRKVIGTVCRFCQRKDTSGIIHMKAENAQNRRRP